MGDEVPGLTEVDALTALEKWFRADTHRGTGRLLSGQRH
jgi:hypothetical protein